MSVTYPPGFLPFPDEGQDADVWVRCTCGCAWDPTMLSSCQVCDTEITRLTARIAELEKALGWFLSDDRFRVAVGGSPHVVEKMIADARTTLEASERGGGE